MTRTARARIAAAAGAGLLVACTQTDMSGDPTDPGDPCAATATCVEVDVRSFVVQTIDQLELDVVINGRHAAGSPLTTGTLGKMVDLPTSLHLALDLPGPSLIDVDVIAAGKLGGSVLGTAGSSVTVQPGHQATMGILLEQADFCVEGALYCGGTGIAVVGDSRTLYRCTGGVPIFYMQCSSGCFPHYEPNAACVGDGLCRDGGSCGGEPSTM